MKADDIIKELLKRKGALDFGPDTDHKTITKELFDEYAYLWQKISKDSLITILELLQAEDSDAQKVETFMFACFGAVFAMGFENGGKAAYETMKKIKEKERNSSLSN